MPICASFTNAYNGGGGVGLASVLLMPILPKMENTVCHLGNIYADILIFANANVA